MNGITICGTGSALPENCLNNNDLTVMVDTSDEWITSRTGIKNRHIAKNETTAELAALAAQRAIENSKINNNEIGLIIVATFTPDYFTPSTACLVQSKLGLNDVPLAAFDINAACSGFVYALTVAGSMMMQNPDKYALVIGSEIVSKTIDYNDRSTCILFGDGAGAVVLKHKDNARLISYLDSSGNKDILNAPICDRRSGTVSPPLKMNGSEVYQFAVETIPKCITNVLEQAKCTLEQVRFIICHQANSRILASAAQRLGIKPDLFVTNLERVGNTSAASIPLLLDEMNRDGLLVRGDKIIMAGFGGGLTWGSVLLEW
ncbi:MAG: ketoacyl-ACP synthase III [Oscillospiraceae bacterium]|nr:ketoacyl-ACP synthase III [Oscillospiraceae bacterium]